PSALEVTQFISALPSAVPVHEQFNLQRELFRLVSGKPHRGIAAQVIRYLHTQSGKRNIDSRVTAAIIVSDMRRSVAEFALATGESPRSLSRHCRRAHLPKPVALLGWT